VRGRPDERHHCGFLCTPSRSPGGTVSLLCMVKQSATGAAQEHALTTDGAADAQACHWLIDELKAKVPIWKKEFFEGGEVWKENAEARRHGLTVV
jgi:hypothetical protein